MVLLCDAKGLRKLDFRILIRRSPIRFIGSVFRRGSTFDVIARMACDGTHTGSALLQYTRRVLSSGLSCCCGGASLDLQKYGVHNRKHRNNILLCLQRVATLMETETYSTTD